jgi:hypothetical protein
MPEPPSPPAPSRWWARTAGSVLILLTAAGTVALLLVLGRTVLGLWQ